MKVVLFCGGLGLRLREAGDPAPRPKPMATIGYRPMLWHIMRYYAHFGHTEFILCLGYRAEIVKDFFLNYQEALSNDFVLSHGGEQVELLGRDIADWRITCVSTGLTASVGERLRAVERYIGDDEMFLANYADVLTDLPLPEMIDALQTSGKSGSFLCVRPRYTFHVVGIDEGAVVRDITPVSVSDIRINGGYFVFRREIFQYIHAGEDLVDEPFRRMIEKEDLLGYPYDGFWAPLDTLKDRDDLEQLHATGSAPWMVWERERRR